MEEKNITEYLRTTEKVKQAELKEHITTLVEKVLKEGSEQKSLIKTVTRVTTKLWSILNEELLEKYKTGEEYKDKIEEFVEIISNRILVVNRCLEKKKETDNIIGFTANEMEDITRYSEGKRVKRIKEIEGINTSPWGAQGIPRSGTMKNISYYEPEVLKYLLEKVKSEETVS